MTDYKWLYEILNTYHEPGNDWPLAPCPSRLGKECDCGLAEAKQSIIAHLEASKPEKIPTEYRENWGYVSKVFKNARKGAIDEYERNIRNGGKQ